MTEDSPDLLEQAHARVKALGGALRTRQTGAVAGAIQHAIAAAAGAEAALADALRDRAQRREAKDQRE
jgi:hypothetical protein